MASFTGEKKIIFEDLVVAMAGKTLGSMLVATGTTEKKLGVTETSTHGILQRLKVIHA